MGLSLPGRCERWVVRPSSPPRLRRYCPGCGVAREFVSSGRFRMNAQKKALDVWLKYRCQACEAVWKAPIFERLPTSRLDPALREAFERDDPAAVERYAFDARRWRAHVIEIVSDEELQVVRSALEQHCDTKAHRCIHLETPFPCDVRLDRLLAAELGCSRVQLQRAFQGGVLTVTPRIEDALRRRVSNGQCVRLLLSPPAASPGSD